jgi:hypothetical protein
LSANGYFPLSEQLNPNLKWIHQLTYIVSLQQSALAEKRVKMHRRRTDQVVKLERPQPHPRKECADVWESTSSCGRSRSNRFSLNSFRAAHGTSFWATRNIAVNDDGTRVREAGCGREGEEFFKYEEPDVSFKFEAGRLVLAPSKVIHRGEPPTNVVFEMFCWNKRHPQEQVRGEFP